VAACAVGVAIIAPVTGSQLSPAGAVGAREAPVLIQLTSLPGRESFPALSPSGDRIAFVWDGGRGGLNQAVHVMTLGSDAPERLTTEEGLCEWPVWSHDGRTIAFIPLRDGNPELWVTDAQGQALRQLTHVGGAWLYSPSWSPDDTRVAFVALVEGQGRVCTVDVRTGATRTLTEPGPCELAPSWSGDGQWVYVSRQRGSEWVIARRPAAGGPPVRVTSGTGFGAIEAPGGDAVYYGRLVDGAPELWRVSLDSGVEERFLGLGSRQVQSWTLRPGGVYFCAPRDAHADTWDVAFRDLSSNLDEIVLTVTSRSPLRFDVSPDETLIVFDRELHPESDILALRGSPDGMAAG